MADVLQAKTPRIATGLRSAPQGPWLGHIPALDGLRGLAVLMVMFSHFSIIGGIGIVASMALRFVGCGALALTCSLSSLDFLSRASCSTQNRHPMLCGIFICAAPCEFFR